MRRVLLPLAILVSIAGCDWIHFAFTNSIPFTGTDTHDFHVYLGVDGLAYRSYQAAQERGAFQAPEWRGARFISMFPATSDASWTRILHTEPIGGYEIEYYNPKNNTIVNKGIPGLLKHILPNFSESINFESKYLTAWDYRANGFLHSVGAYHDTFVNFAESIDNLFITLEGRMKTKDTFSGYLLEFDVMGHMQKFDDITEALVILSRRIERFRSRNPERKIYFTLFSDHGLDFVQVPVRNLMVFENELPRVGVTSVDTLDGRDFSRQLFAVPIEHTRVTYIALHTHPSQTELVAARVSKLESVDLAVAKLVQQRDGLNWYGIWADGKPVATFGFDPGTDRYLLPQRGDYSRLGLSLSFAPQETTKALSDDELFSMTNNSTYPDLFYRVRSGLSAVGTVNPADILVSFRPGYASMGFRLPGGANDMAISGFHGSLEWRGSQGSLITNERDLPDAVRSETVFDLFPKAKEHLRQRGVQWVDGDPHASLQYTP